MTVQWTDEAARAVLEEIFQTAVDSAAPGPAVRRHLPEKPKGRCVVIGAGKASAQMAAAVDEAWPDVNLSGVVVTRYGQAVPAGRIQILEASHPIPDTGSLIAGKALLNAVEDLDPGDLVLALISGGGSSLLASPVEGVTLADKIAVNKALLESGATIHEMNLVRSALSKIKGGGLARAAAPARVINLIISDVPGDDPSIVASGPTVPIQQDIEIVNDIVAQYRLGLPISVQKVLSRGLELQVTPEDPEIHIIASARIALMAAAETAHAKGLTPFILGDGIEGESRELGIIMAGIAKSIQTGVTQISRPALMLSGGETTVTIRDSNAGRGGRNTEFALSLAIKLGEIPGIWAIACDTDGIDGTDDAAGAFVSPSTLSQAREADCIAKEFLHRHDSYSLFNTIGSLIRTGPTHTNVNDFRAVLVT